MEERIHHRVCFVLCNVSQLFMQGKVKATVCLTKIDRQNEGELSRVRLVTTADKLHHRSINQIN